MFNTIQLFYVRFSTDHQQQTSVLSPDAAAAEDDDEEDEGPGDDEDVPGESVGGGGQQRDVLVLVDHRPQTDGQHPAAGQLEPEEVRRWYKWETFEER